MKDRAKGNAAIDKEGTMKDRAKGNAAIDDEPTTKPTSDPSSTGFGDLHLETVFGKHVERLLGPYVAHRAACDPAACSCGLAAAIGELKRTEVMALRYGV